MNCACKSEIWLLATLTVFCYSIALAALFVLWYSIFALATSAAGQYFILLNP